MFLSLSEDANAEQVREDLKTAKIRYSAKFVLIMGD